jgi:hypothetical protein
VKIKITRGTTINGKPVHEGSVIDVDRGVYVLLRSQGQAVIAPESAAPLGEIKNSKGK